MFGIEEGRPGKLWCYLDKFHGMKINSRYLLRGTWNKSNKTVWWFIDFFWCSWRIGSARTTGAYLGSTHIPVYLTFEVTGKSSWSGAGVAVLFAASAEPSKGSTAQCWARDCWQLATGHWCPIVRCFPVSLPPGSAAFLLQHHCRIEANPNSVTTHPKTSQLMGSCSSKDDALCCLRDTMPSCCLRDMSC